MGCRLPVYMIVLGVWGCPDSFLRTDTDGISYERTFAYDSDGRMTDFDASVHTSYTWDAERLVKTTREQLGGIVDVAEYRDRDAQLIAVDEKGRIQEEITLDAERPVVVDEYGNGFRVAHTLIEWRDDRPQRVSVEVTGAIRGSVTRVPLYECPK